MARIGVIARDVAGLLGLACIVAGVAQVFAPAAWIVGGMIAVAISAVLARRG